MTSTNYYSITKCTCKLWEVHLISFIMFFLSCTKKISFLIMNIYIIMWSCPGNMSKYYPGLRDILSDRRPDWFAVIIFIIIYYHEKKFKQYILFQAFNPAITKALFPGVSFQISTSKKMCICTLHEPITLSLLILHSYLAAVLAGTKKNQQQINKW